MRRRNNPNPHHSGGTNRTHGSGTHNTNRPRRYNNNPRGGYNAAPEGQGDHANVSRVRRHAMTQREKYHNMARDILSSGDRVQAEYYFQHVEHYTRVLNELPPEEIRQYRPQGQGPRDPYPQGEGDNMPQENAAPENRNENGNGNGNFREEEEAPRPAASALPSFITGGGNRRPQAQANPAPRQNDEE